MTALIRAVFIIEDDSLSVASDGEESEQKNLIIERSPNVSMIRQW